MSNKKLQLLGAAVSLIVTEHAAPVKASARETRPPLTAIAGTGRTTLVGITKGYLFRFKVHLAAHSSLTTRSFWQVALILLSLHFLRLKGDVVVLSSQEPPEIAL